MSKYGWENETGVGWGGGRGLGVSGVNNLQADSSHQRCGGSVSSKSANPLSRHSRGVCKASEHNHPLTVISIATPNWQTLHFIYFFCSAPECNFVGLAVLFKIRVKTSESLNDLFLKKIIKKKKRPSSSSAK